MSDPDNDDVISPEVPKIVVVPPSNVASPDWVNSELIVVLPPETFKVSPFEPVISNELAKSCKSNIVRPPEIVKVMPLEPVISNELEGLLTSTVVLPPDIINVSELSEPEISTVDSSFWTSNVVVPSMIVPSSVGVILVSDCMYNLAPSWILNLTLCCSIWVEGGKIVSPFTVTPSYKRLTTAPTCTPVLLKAWSIAYGSINREKLPGTLPTVQ